MTTAEENGVPLISLERVAFRLGTRVVFPRTDWVIRAGEQWALLGGNGSGKSVLALGLMGAIPAVRGELVYHYEAPDGESPEQRIACVSFERQRALAGDGVAAARWCSIEQEACAAVRDLIRYEQVEEINPYEVRDCSAARRVFERRKGRVIRLLGIRPLLDRQLVQLSNGEMRKLLIAQALLKNPRLLILDDPFAGLDADYRERFRRLVGELVHAGGMQILLTVSHEEDLPESITHVALLDRCRIAAVGLREDMLRSRRAQDLWQAPAVKRRTLEGRKAVPARAGRELLRMEHARIVYGRRVILRDLSWAVHEGESWAVLGPNGAGKSALLSLIAGNSPQVFASEVYLFGRRRGTGETREEVRRAIGEVSPELHLHFNDTLTVFETVLTGFTDSLVLTARPPAARRRDALRVLRRFGLSRELDTPLRGLSAGYQRLALLARALVKRPKLLLLDEPCQGLDAAHRARFLRMLEDIIGTGETTVLLTTHRRDEIPSGMRSVLRLNLSGIPEIQNGSVDGTKRARCAGPRTAGQ